MSDQGRPVAIVIGSLAPYTHLLYERLAQILDRPLHVLACSHREKGRSWERPASHSYHFEVCPGFAWHRSRLSVVYLNPSVARRLRQIRPSVLILNDFSPTMLLAAVAARARALPYGIRTDGRVETDPGGRSRLHRQLRRRIVAFAEFGLGASRGSVDLLRSYGLTKERTYLTPLFPGWTSTSKTTRTDVRPFDVLFCGALDDEIKGVAFFANVVVQCAKLGRSISVRVVGDGPLRDFLRERFEAAGVSAHFDGYLKQEDLEQAYASAKVLLFPSRGDVWGIVVHEALQSGTCVIASPHSGAAVELLEAYRCGHVLPLERDLWTNTVLALLDAPDWRSTLINRSAEALSNFSLDRAAAIYGDALRPFLA